MRPFYQRLEIYQLIRKGRRGVGSPDDSRMTIWSSVVQLNTERGLFDTFIKFPGIPIDVSKDILK